MEIEGENFTQILKNHGGRLVFSQDHDLLLFSDLILSGINFVKS